MTRLIAVSGLVAMAASTALAQNTGFRLTDGDSVYDITSAGATGTIPTTAEPGGTSASAQANYIASGGTSGIDNAYLNWWWYRINGTSTRELGVRQTTGTAVRTSSAANQVTYDITTTSSLRFTLSYTLTDTGATSANLLTAFTVSNTGATPLDLTVMNMFDIFLAGEDAGDRLRSAVSPGAGINGNRFLNVSDSGTTGVHPTSTLQFAGYGSDGYGIGTFSGVSGQLTDTSLDNFADVNVGAPVEPAAGDDISAVMQWNLGTIAAGGSRTIYSAIAVDGNGTASAVPTPGALALLGVGGLLLGRRRR